MFSSIRKRLTYANVAMTLALVFAMSTGAYAAGKYVITSTKQIKPSVLASLKGTNGKPGTTGPAGPAGPAGPQGPQGAAGAKGENGVSGSNGASVTSKEVTTKESICAKQGGVELTAAENKKTTLCNGKEGSPWTSGGTLPSGKTETGAWFSISSAQKLVRFAVSFPIPLEGSFQQTASNVFVVSYKEFTEARVPAGCNGGTPTNPKAAPGDFCLFEGPISEEEPLVETKGEVSANLLEPGTNTQGVGTTGTIVTMVATEANDLYGGTWAMTAP